MMGRNCLFLAHAKSTFYTSRFISFLRNISSGPCINKSQARECPSSLDNDHHERTPASVLENPKGMRDYGPIQTRKKSLIIQKIVNHFKSHGAELLDTPLFELRHILTGKYGKDCEQICLADDGGILSMRYDLTVPFARYVAMNKIKCFKRYQVGKVYRLKCTSVVGNQLKEFTQCDFDIAGRYNLMLPDVECVRLLNDVFQDLEVEDHIIKVNHRQLLYGIFEICGVPHEKFNSMCSSIHRSEKLPWEQVRAEMVNGHGLCPEAADRMGEYIKMKGGKDLVEELLLIEKLAQNNLARQALQEMQLFFTYCEWLDIDKVCFDLSLAGRFDYYTGIVFKGMLKGKADHNSEKSGVWAAGGGRYDNLVGMFDSKNKSVPCVGMSFMVENILSSLENEFETWNQNLITGNVSCSISEDTPGQCAKGNHGPQADQSTRSKDLRDLHDLRISVPKGTRDFTPFQMKVREEIFKKVITCFEKHGFEPLDTPLFEYKDYLHKDEDDDCNKQIFDAEADDSKPLSMRYDLTLPFARYIAMNCLKSMKRYQIGLVGRRDSPSIISGRYRSFYQCDIDIAGDYDPMVADVECITVLVEILKDIEIEEFIIRVNHRKILDGILQVCGVPVEKMHPVISAIDKLDKISWDEVKAEMTNEKGLDVTVADHIGKYIQNKGGRELIEELLKSEELSQNDIVKQGLEDLLLFFTYCDKSDLCNKVSLDLSLARGFDYYTGIIFEAVLKGLVDSEGEMLNLGSIAGGGRYDNLVGLFNSGKRNIPCVGMSLGIERIFIILEAKLKASGKQIRTTETEVLVTTPQRKHAEQRTRMCSNLWKSGIKTELQYKLNPKLLDQLQYCEDRRIPWAVVIGQDELNAGIVKLRNVETREEYKISQERMIEEIKKRCNTETT